MSKRACESMLWVDGRVVTLSAVVGIDARLPRIELVRRGLPREALAADLQSSGGGSTPRPSRKVLLCGSLATHLASLLTRCGAHVWCVDGVEDALRAMRDEAFDIVAVDVHGNDGLALLKAVKLAEATDAGSTELLAGARAQHARTPFVVLPMPGEDDYAVIVEAPCVAFLEDTARIPVHEAILRVNVAALLASTPRLA